jgi:hypothetical protein
MKRRIRVYIAGPYSKGDVAVNVRTAIEMGTKLWDSGLFAPYVPHLTHFWHLVTPKPYETWLELDNEWIPACDCILRLPGDSSGADKEIKLAESLGLPVFFTEADLFDYYSSGALNPNPKASYEDRYGV